MDLNPIFSAAAFVLNSILLSNFIIPQVQKLKEIKESLINFNLTYAPRTGDMQEINKKGDEQDKQIEEMHKIFDSYRIRSNELYAVIIWAYISIVIAIISYVLLYFFRDYTIIYIRNIRIISRDLIILSHFALQLVVLIFVIRTYAVKPDKIQDIHYLATEMDVNPHVLVNALGLDISYSTMKDFFEKPSREEPLRINLDNTLRAYGFRFLYVVSNQEGDVFYLSFGPITANTKEVWRHLIIPTKYQESGEYNRVEIGRFQFNLIEKKQELDVVLFIFIPFFKNEVYSPIMGTSRYEVGGLESASFTTASTGGMWKIDSSDVYRKIKFKGAGLKMTDLKYEGNTKDKIDEVTQKIVEKYGRKVCQVNKITQFTSIKGDLLEKSRHGKS